LLFQEFRSFCFGLIDRDREVSFSIQLNYQPALRTIKVDNVSTYAALAPKLLSLELAALEKLPQRRFRR
jgi:hypothetical protein